jgi:CBS domain-containing protein
MKVDAVYRPGVLSIDAEAVLSEAAAQMDYQEVGALAVLERGSLLGIVTERDLVRAIAEGADLSLATVGEYMTPYPATVTPDTELSEAAEIMLNLGARHLPVVEDGRPMGMVSARDLLVDHVWPGGE